MKTITKIIITALIAIILSEIISGVYIDNLWTAIWVAITIAILNVTIKPILIVLTMPITLLTFGFFLLVVNVMVISLADAFVDGFAVRRLYFLVFHYLFVDILL